MTQTFEGGRRIILEHNFRKCDEIEYKFRNNYSGKNIYDSEIKIGEMEKVIGEVKNNKAPGYDGIAGEMIKIIFKINKDLFLEIMNLIWKKGKFPDIWKRTIVALIPKENKDLHKRENYRPISLLPVWGKIMDKIITNRLVAFLENNNILLLDQCGFRENNSTTNPLSNVK